MSKPATKTLAELQEDRNVAARKIEELRDKFTANDNAWAQDEDRATFDQANDDYDSIGNEMESLRNVEAVNERADRVAEAQRESVSRTEQLPGRGNQTSRISHDHAEVEHLRGLAFNGWIKRQMGEDVTPEQIKAAELTGFNLDLRKLNIPLTRGADFHNFRSQYNSPRCNELRSFERRALSGFDAAAGAAVVPSEFMNTFEKAMLDFSGVRQVADIMRTATGNEISWPGGNDTGNEGGMIGENVAVADTVQPTFEAIKWKSYEFTSNEVLVPTTLLRDAVIDLASLLGEMLGERIGRALNNKFTTGTGNNQPKGVVVASTLGKTAASATAIVSDEIIDLEYSVGLAYRTNGVYMMHDDIALAIRKLKDTTNQYLWQPSYQLGTPTLLNGRPIVTNAHMQSTIVASTKTILFGDFSKYKIREVGSIRMYRLVERHRVNDQDGFLAFGGFDGNLLAVGGASTAPIKHLLQAA